MIKGVVVLEVAQQNMSFSSTFFWFPQSADEGWRKKQRGIQQSVYIQVSHQDTGTHLLEEEEEGRP
jgi:hypothetical protein